VFRWTANVLKKCPLQAWLNYVPIKTYKLLSLLPMYMYIGRISRCLDTSSQLWRKNNCWLFWLKSLRTFLVESFYDRQKWVVNSFQSLYQQKCTYLPIHFLTWLSAAHTERKSSGKESNQHFFVFADRENWRKNIFFGCRVKTKKSHVSMLWSPFAAIFAYLFSAKNWRFS
jgi:hypothetical protein